MSFNVLYNVWLLGNEYGRDVAHTITDLFVVFFWSCEYLVDKSWLKRTCLLSWKLPTQIFTLRLASNTYIWHWIHIGARNAKTFCDDAKWGLRYRDSWQTSQICHTWDYYTICSSLRSYTCLFRNVEKETRKIGIRCGHNTIVKNFHPRWYTAGKNMEFGKQQ